MLWAPQDKSSSLYLRIGLNLLMWIFTKLTCIKTISMASSSRRNRYFDFRVNCPWIPDWYLANPPVLWCHMLLTSSTAQLIWREGGADRVWGGGQWTLHTKGYTELSLCVCALCSVCFSFPLCVREGKHACANVHWLIYFFNIFFSCCIDRK